MRHQPLVLPAALAIAGLALSTLPAQAAPAPPADRAVPATTAARQAPGLRLFTPDHRPVLTVHNAGAGEDEWVEFNPAIYLGSTRSRLELDVLRADAGHRITAKVHVDGRTRVLPGKLLDGWLGLKDAFTLTWRTAAGTPIAQYRTNWCPNDGQPSRLGPHAATETAFTYGCSSHPFTRGQRWGIDRGWARQVLGYQINAPQNLPNGAVLTVTLRWALAKAFGLTDAQRTIRLAVSVKHVTDDDGGGPGPVPVPGLAATAVVRSKAVRLAEQAPSAPRLARTGRLSAGLLPDLISLPAFGISTHAEDGHDLLDFAATVYNGGQGPLVAEGFRRGSKQVMDAYQFFYRDDRQVASRKVGTMEYDARPSHLHWHFEDFAVYDLVNRNKKRLRTSGKEAFCLAPTDAINLLLSGAVVNPGNGDLSTACGDISSVWVREVLAAGWGDTYSQQRAGQSIDITGLPNGTYWIRVTANPVHRLHETTRKNNVSLRRVILGGTAGHRTVTVPNYGLINSEDYFGEPGGQLH